MRKPLTLTVDAWGNVIVARTLGNEGTFVAKLDKEGNVLWQQTIATQGEGLLSEMVGPTAAVASDPVRDSVEPLLIDPELEAMQRDLRGPSKLFRGLGIAAILAGLFAFGLAGGAAARTGAFGNATARPAAAVVGIRGATQVKAQAAVDGVNFEHDAIAPDTNDEPIETVDDTVAAAEPQDEVAQPIGASAPAGVPTSPPFTSEPVATEIVSQPVTETATQPLSEPAAEPATESGPTGTSDEDLALIGAAAIRKETLRLLNAGQMAEAAQLAMQLVASAPSDAFSYLCLGAALQAQGRIAEAASAYRSCAEFARHGDVSECRALAGM
jgi:hypothetical protein